MQIWVKLMTEGSKFEAGNIELDVDPLASIGDIKQHIVQLTQIPIEFIRLQFYGRECDDSKTVADHEVIPGATLCLKLA